MIDSQPFALAGARVIDGTGKKAMEDTVVLVEGSRIVNVCQREEIGGGGRYQIIDVAGKTIVPGLIDSHVHLGQLPLNRFGVEDPMSLFETFMKMFVAQGVTTVRDTGSPDLDNTFRLLKAGDPLWPRYYGSGPNLDGPPGGPHAGLRVVDTPDEARANTIDLIENGADFAKIYVWMTEEPLRAVVAAAHSRGKKVAAHVGNTLTAEAAVRLGVDALEHIRVGPELLTASQQAEIDRLPRRAHDHLLSFRPWRYIDVGSDRTTALFDLFVERGVHLTPTLVLARGALLNEEAHVRNPPGIELMAEGVVRHWESKAWIGDFSKEDWTFASREWEQQLAFVGRAHEAGVKIVAGTDMPNPFILPGYGLHEELALLSEAGLSNHEVIRAATFRGAELLDVASDLGTIEKGKLADLVITDGDPASDLAVLREPWAVLKDGQVVAGTAAADLLAP